MSSLTVETYINFWAQAEPAERVVMRDSSHYRRSYSVREHPRNGPVWVAVGIVTALVVTANVLLVTLATPSSDMRLTILAILIAIAMNGALVVVSLIGTRIFGRVSALALVPYVIVSVTFPVIAIVADSLIILSTPASAGEIEIRRRMIVGNELHLIVETYRSYGYFMSHSLKTADAKGYFIIVDLSSSEPLAKRARVYGPLWDVPNSRSSLSFTAGPKFTKDDVDAARATPMCVFDADGTLMKFTLDPARNVLTREAFVASPDSGSWQPQGEVKPVEDHLEPMSHDRLITASRRFILLYQEGEGKLFDLFTGERKDDPWLTKSFAHARSNKSLGNARLFLTDDLNHLVVVPRSISNKGRTEETFQLGGKTYNRGEVGLAYSRPDPSPKVFARTREEKKSDAPDGAYSIDGNLYLYSLMEDERSLRLYTLDGKKDIRAHRDEAPPKLAWQLSAPFRDIQHVPEKDELVIPDHENETKAKGGINCTVSMIRWNYKKGTVSRQDTPIIDLFYRSGGQLLPRSPIAVK